MVSNPNRPDEFDEEETATRRDAALLRALNTPHKRQSEMKIGKLNGSIASDPTILALRRALDRRALQAGENPTETLVRVILGCLPQDIFHPVFLPTNGTRGPRLAISFKPAFRTYLAFAAEYWASLAHKSFSPISSESNASDV